MHLWPSLKLRDSFKSAYLKQVDWNLHRMKSEKPKNQSNQQKLLNQQAKDDAAAIDDSASESSNLKTPSAFAVICRESLLVLSCCYCCFCCGACMDQEEN